MLVNILFIGLIELITCFISMLSLIFGETLSITPALICVKNKFFFE